MTESSGCTNKILLPFCLASKHFNAIREETEWKGRLVHLITGIFECIFPINYIIALFDRTIFKKPLSEQTPLPISSPPPPLKDDVEKPIIIGIDLGTTNSCVAVMKDSLVEVIPDANGARTTPSVVCYKDGQPLVGAVAKDLESTLYSTKRFIGRKYDEVASEIRAVPYKVIKSENGDAVFEINGKIVTPEDAAAQILLKMKQIAEAHLGKKITKAVVTVPAYFNDAQRQATREAGRIAGLDVVRIIAEPTAAALAYGVDKAKTSQNIAVYDLGGGTFDISILNIEEGIFEVRSTNGDTHLGGDDFDNAIVDWMLAEFKKMKGIDLSQDKMVMKHLRDAAIKAKIELSAQESTQIHLPFGSLTLSRTKLEELCRTLIERSIEPCQKALNDAGLSPKGINQAVLVGGMTRMPAVQGTVHKVFERTPNTSVNPDEAVAIGAAIQAGVLAGDPLNVLLMDVAPLTLGIELQGGVLEPLIRRNTSIPTAKRQIFSTAEDNQSSVKVRVFQGERPMAQDNKEIGSFELDGIPPLPRGTPQIEVEFHINSDGILEVKAKDKLTGKEQKIKIAAKSGLSKQDVQDKIKDGELHEAEDRIRLESVRIRNEADQLAFRAQQTLDQVKNRISSQLAAETQSRIDALKKALKDDGPAVIQAKNQVLQDYMLADLYPALQALKN